MCILEFRQDNTLLNLSVQITNSNVCSGNSELESNNEPALFNLARNINYSGERLTQWEVQG